MIVWFVQTLENPFIKYHNWYMFLVPPLSPTQLHDKACAACNYDNAHIKSILDTTNIHTQIWQKQIPKMADSSHFVKIRGKIHVHAIILSEMHPSNLKLFYVAIDLNYTPIINKMKTITHFGTNNMTILMRSSCHKMLVFLDSMNGRALRNSQTPQN